MGTNFIHRQPVQCRRILYSSFQDKCCILWSKFIKFLCFYVCSQICEKRLLTSSRLFCLSVLPIHPSSCVEQLRSTGWIFMKFYIGVFLYVEKIQVSLKPDKNYRYFTLRPICIFDHISLSSS